LIENLCGDRSFVIVNSLPDCSSPLRTRVLYQLADVHESSSDARIPVFDHHRGIASYGCVCDPIPNCLLNNESCRKCVLPCLRSPPKRRDIHRRNFARRPVLNLCNTRGGSRTKCHGQNVTEIKCNIYRQ